MVCSQNASRVARIDIVKNLKNLYFCINIFYNSLLPYSLLEKRKMLFEYEKRSNAAAAISHVCRADGQKLSANWLGKTYSRYPRHSGIIINIVYDSGKSHVKPIKRTRTKERLSVGTKQ